MKLVQNPKFLMLLAFLAGASVMSLELCASRILSPGFGNGIYVWGSLIGVIMAALSVGYWLGGRMADNGHDPKILFKALIFSAIIISLIPTLGYSIVAVSTVLGLILGPLISSLIIFAAPMAMISTVSPMVIKYHTKKLSDVGGSAGQVFAVSTIGSIFGTFATAFILIPGIGTRATLLANALLLFAVGAIGLYDRWSTFMVVFLLPGIVYPPLYAQGEKTIYRTESAYNIISVLDDSSSRILKMNWDLQYLQSYMKKDGTLTGYYYDTFLIGPILAPGKNTLYLGLAGGVSINQLLNFYDITIDAVEIDPAVVNVAKEYFNVKEGDHLRIYVSDGRQFLKTSGKYDLIDVDVFNGADIPYHMVSTEFFNETSAHMTEDGLLMMNVLNDKGDRALTHAIAATMRQTFQSVYIVNSTTNDIVLAFKAKKTKEELSKTLQEGGQQRLSHIIDNFDKYAYEYNLQGGDIFTDDKTDIEEVTFNELKT
jgi:spermidine synthase